MAERVTIQLLDDLDGSEATESIRFAWEGRSLVVDLNQKNADKFRKAIEPFATVARADGVVEAPAPRRGRPAGSTNREKPERDYDIKDLRAWAAERKIELSSRGRIAAEIVAQYKADALWQNK